jgi:hypothetical protein
LGTPNHLGLFLQFAQGFLYILCKFLLGDEDLGPGVLQDIGDLFGRKSIIDWNQDRSGQWQFL